MSVLASAWAAQGWEVNLLTLDAPGDASFFALDPRVRRWQVGVSAGSLGVGNWIANNLARVSGLRRVIAALRPDVVLSFIELTNLLVLAALRATGIPIVVSERTDPAFGATNPALGIARRALYPSAASVVVQTSRAAQYFSGALSRRVVVIPNPVRSLDLVVDGERPNVVLGVGRLSHEKGFDVLIRAWGHVAPSFPQWKLRLVGDGRDRGMLEELARELKIADSIEFRGRQVDVDREYSQAGVFVLPSRREGFPNALAEAMSAGLPVIASDCPNGPRELLEGGRAGALVSPENDVELASALSRFLGDEALRVRFGALAQEVALQYSVPSVVSQWSAVLVGALNQAGVRIDGS